MLIYKYIPLIYCALFCYAIAVVVVVARLRRFCCISVSALRRRPSSRRCSMKQLRNAHRMITRMKSRKANMLMLFLLSHSHSLFHESLQNGVVLPSPVFTPRTKRKMLKAHTKLSHFHFLHACKSYSLLGLIDAVGALQQNHGEEAQQ